MPITLNGDTGLSGVAGTASTPALVGTDTDTGVYYSAANTLDFATGGTAAAQLDSSQNLKFNSGYGSVTTAYGCRAWVSFSGTTSTSIRGSGNVSSVTYNSTGNYTVNFTNAMPDANYTTNCTSQRSGANLPSFGFLASSGTYSTTAVQVRNCDTGNTSSDAAIFNVICLR